MKFKHNQDRREYKHYIRPINLNETQDIIEKFETVFSTTVLYSIVYILTMLLYSHIFFKILRLGSLSDNIFINLVIPTCFLGIAFYILYRILYKFFYKKSPNSLKKAILPSLIFVTFVVSPIYFYFSVIMFFLNFYRTPVGFGDLVQNYLRCPFLLLIGYIGIGLLMSKRKKLDKFDQ